VDSFGGRWLREICTAPGVTILERVADAYAGLRIISTHPRVDRSRIALMGFSHGGAVTLLGALAWARDRHVPPGGAAFRAFLPFYPVCAARFPELRRLAGPVRIHHGDADDWTPLAPCQEVAALMREHGQDATVTVYPGALHSFDNIGRAPQRLPGVRNPSGCRIELPSVETPVPAGELDRCLTRGATIGWNPEATEAARKNVLAQLAELLR
jgi:dienelactone hydrolase